MLTFDFICISVLEATPDAKVFLSLLVEIWVCQLRSVGFGRPARVMVWASLEDIRWTAGSAFLFSSSGQPCGAFVVPRQNWKGSFRGFLLFLFLFFLFFFFVVVFSLVILCAERVRLWRFYVWRFLLCRQNWVHLAVCELFIYLFIPAPALHLPHCPPREHLTLPYFLPCCEELQRRRMALTRLELVCELCWLMSWDSSQPELLHKYGNPQSSLSVELNDRSMTRFIVIRFLFWRPVDRHKSCLKKKRWFIFINQYSHYCVNIMDLFYLNGSLLFLLLNYRWNILFSQKKWKRSI